jgi:hypothetical protein
MDKSLMRSCLYPDPENKPILIDFTEEELHKLKYLGLVLGAVSTPETKANLPHLSIEARNEMFKISIPYTGEQKTHEV